MEVLACKLRVHPDLGGIKIPNSTVSLPVVSLYADDTSAIVTSDPGIKAVFDTYSRFERASGSKLNLSKCKGLWLGSWRGRSDLPVDIDWSSDTIKVLGIFIAFGDLDAANWNPGLDAVSKCLTSGGCAHCRIVPCLSRAFGMLRLLYICPVGYSRSLVHLFLISFGLVKKTWFDVMLSFKRKNLAASL